MGRGWERGRGELLFKGDRVSALKKLRKKNLEMDGSDGGINSEFL